MLPYSLLGYRTTVRTSTWATPYLLVYGTEAVVPVEVEISSLRIIQEAELSNAEWVSKRIDQLALIDEKRMIVVSHGRLYRQRITRAFHKKVRAKDFKVGHLVLKVFSLIKTNTKESSRQIGRVLTWFVKYYLEVLWSCRRWMALYGSNLSTQMLSRDTMCEVSCCIFYHLLVIVLFACICSI